MPGDQAVRPAAAQFFGDEAPVDVLRMDTSVRLNTVLVIATVVIGLIIDRHGGFAGQLAVGAWCWILMFRLIATSPSNWRLPFYCCLVWATAGEIFLSLVWGLYTYRLGNIPYFIPPGHVFLFWLGVVYARRLPRFFLGAVPVAAVAYAVYALTTGLDTISVALTGLFLLCWLQPRGRRLYCLMLVMALTLELYATWMGNWVWHANVPYVDLWSSNPPMAAGGFYCVLDVLVGLSVRFITSRRAPSPAQV